MVLMESQACDVSKVYPNFMLEDPYGKQIERDQFFGEKGLVIVFTCNHCPYAKAIWDRLIDLANYAESVSVGILAINPNINPDYPEDSPENMKQFIEETGLPFPYLVDENQTVARDYDAQCTPDLYLFDSAKQLVYRGRLDDNWQDATAVTEEDLKNAVTSLAHGDPVSDTQIPSIGCSIKWQL